MLLSSILKLNESQLYMSTERSKEQESGYKKYYDVRRYLDYHIIIKFMVCVPIEKYLLKT